MKILAIRSEFCRTYRACRELGIEPKTEIRRFASSLLEKKFVIESNLLRRQLTTFQRIKLGKPLLEIYKELAKERQGTRTDIRQNFDEGSSGRALDKFAESVGSNRETVNEALWLMENAPKEKLEKLDSGNRAISNLYKELKPKEETSEGILRRKFDVWNIAAAFKGPSSTPSLGPPKATYLK